MANNNKNDNKQRIQALETEVAGLRAELEPVIQMARQLTPEVLQSLTAAPGQIAAVRAQAAAAQEQAAANAAAIARMPGVQTDQTMQRAAMVVGQLAAAVGSKNVAAVAPILAGVGDLVRHEVVSTEERDARSYENAAIGTKRVSARLFAAMNGQHLDCSAEEIQAFRAVFDAAADAEKAEVRALIARNNADLPGDGDLRSSAILRRVLEAVAKAECAAWARAPEQRQVENRAHIERLAAFVKRGATVSKSLRDVLASASAAAAVADGAAEQPKREPAGRPACSFCKKRGHVAANCWLAAKQAAPKAEAGTARESDGQSHRATKKPRTKK